MKTQKHRFISTCGRILGILALFAWSTTLRADNHYVSSSGANSPSYGTGYANLQAAIDASTAGDTVWIEDGFVCDTGGTFVTGGGVTNRILLNKAITVRNVSGTKDNPARIVGAHHEPGVTVNGSASIRCLYVSAAATVIGLQLTNGTTSATTGNGGGAYLVSTGIGTMFSNCVIVANNAVTYGGGVYGGASTVLSKCVIVANYATTRGGGVYGVALRDCEIIDNKTSSASGNGGGSYGGMAENSRFVGNYARLGGGAYTGTLTDCTIISNSCLWAGGGVASATLSRCLLAFNKSTDQHAGGAYSSALSDCVLTGNTAAYYGAAIHGGSALRCVVTNNANDRASGGVVYGCAMTNSLIQGNSYQHNVGGVVKDGSLVNCLLISNSVHSGLSGAVASGTKIYNSTVANNSSGKAAMGCTLINTIVWNNPSAGSGNFSTNSLIAASAVVSGENNIDGNPLFESAGDWPYRLSGASPCIDQGLGGFAWMLGSDPNTLGLDMSGQRRVIGSAVDMGAFEYMPFGSLISVR